MKAQILKIAGVKNEKEFYKKFPTEEAFMKKHGKALKKAQVGTMIGGEQTPMTKPISYDNLASNAQASVYGISPEEQQRQEALASQQAIANASGQQGGGLADILGSIDPAMIAQLVGGGARNGKMLKKAANGFEGLIKPPAMPKVNAVNLAKTKGFGLSKMEDIPASTDRSFDYAGAFKQMPGALASQAGSIIGAIQDISQNKKDLKKQQMYGKVSDLTLQAASSRAEQPKRRYVRPEDQVMENFRPLGTGTNYLAAANGTMIGGNPTEIQNMYNNPDTMYTDLGFEPLNDANKLKNFKKGGKLNKAVGGITLDSFSGQGGSLGGMLGSKIGGGSGKGGPGSTIGSAVGGILGMAIPIPGVGSFIGSTLGGLAGGLFDSKGQKQTQAAQDKLDQNLQASAFQSGTQNLQTQNKAFMEHGGWVSHDWQPQVIAKFGDADVSQVRAFAQDGMPQYRAGGHLKEYTPPSAAAMYTGRAEYGTQMAMGGDLQVHRGEAETMSYNPYLPGSGETIMFRGPSHDNGGMPVSFGNNGVEVEGGEPAIKMEDGGKQENLVVYGNMMIPEYGVNEINDPKAKGKKFKHYIASLSKQEAKVNKSIEKGVQLVNDYDTGNEFDQLAFNSGKAMMMGGDLKLRTIAERKLDTAAVQNAILDTAEEYGVKSDELAKGKIKMDKDNNMYAEFGKKIMFDKGGKAGKKYDPEFENFIDVAMQLEQANSFQSGNYRGGGSNFGTNKKEIKTPEQAKEFYYKNYWSKVKDLPAGLRTRALQMAINTGDPYGELMVAAGKMSVKDRAATKNQRKDKDITGNKDWQKSKADILKAYNEDPDTFLAKLDAEQDRYYDSFIANNPSRVNSDTRKEFFDDYVGLAKYAAKPFVAGSGPLEDYEYSRMFGRRLSLADKKQKEAEFKKNDPVGYNKALNELNRQFTAEQRMKEGDVPYPTEFVYTPLDSSTTVAQPAPVAQESVTVPQESNESISPREGSIQSDDIIIENPNIRKKPYYENITSLATPGLRPIDVNFQRPDITMPSLDLEEDLTVDEQRKKRFNFNFDKDLLKLGAIGASSALGQFRPSDVENLDAAQLAPEMMALATNQLEPVQAQTFQPLLASPTSFSLQDQLNEVTAQTRAAERMSAYNPEAASMIAAGAYNARNKILGEQFRMNQAEQQRVAEQNRSVLNDAQLKNLAIYDTQYVRQSEGVSKTKQQAIEAMKSIADKTAKNKLENRQLGVMENLYNYRFNRDGQAYNLNNPQFFNYDGGVNATTSGLGAMPNGMLPDYDTDETTGKPKLVGYKLPKETKATKRNGAIVKAIKNL